MTDTGSVKTTNIQLQTALQVWVRRIELALSEPEGSSSRLEKILEFCRNFVPDDIEEEDLEHYSQSLHTDTEFFGSLYREMLQCSSGEGVESIGGNQTTRAVFTLLPPPDLNSSVDIVRELVFISKDGIRWTAEA